MARRTQLRPVQNLALARRFQRRDFEPVEADGGIKALELVESGCFDAVLLDIMKPDLDGLEVLRKIRLDHSSESLPVIMVIAKNESADIVEALGLGANDYVVKPVDFSVALARVNVPFDANRTGVARVISGRTTVVCT